jgi:hypothetical protein
MAVPKKNKSAPYRQPEGNATDNNYFKKTGIESFTGNKHGTPRIKPVLFAGF